ncbi:PAS domain-containing sensor histidine kinase, partial [Streptomyces sp. NPDC001455]
MNRPRGTCTAAVHACQEPDAADGPPDDRSPAPDPRADADTPGDPHRGIDPDDMPDGQVVAYACGRNNCYNPPAGRFT